MMIQIALLGMKLLQDMVHTDWHNHVKYYTEHKDIHPSPQLTLSLPLSMSISWVSIISQLAAFQKC